jgi:hypothetical protein
MSALSVVEPHPSIRPATEAIAIRMADEGIPIRAIARTTRLPSTELYSVLQDAVMRGVIVELPKDDWPTGNTRASRSNAFLGTPLEEDDELKVACSRCFKATRLEASILALMLKRTEVTKDQLHLAIEQNRPEEKSRLDPTDPKMVDVIICHLRKKLKTFGLAIETVWGIGYLISTEQRERAMQMLFTHVRDNQPAPPRVVVNG